MKDKNSDFEFDLWLFGELAGYAAMHDIEGFNRLLDNNPDLENEYFNRRMKQIENIKLPPEFETPEWKEKMLARIHQALDREEKSRD